MRIFPIALLALCLLLTASIADAQVESKPERFTGNTSYLSHTDSSLNQPFRPRTTLDVNADGSFKDAAILLITAQKGWHYLSCHPTHWLIDDKPVVLAEAKHDGNVLNAGYVMETMVQTLTERQLAEFSRANKIEFKVCNDEGEFRSGERDDLRAIAGKVKVTLKP